MRTRPHESPLPGARDEDWDEGVLVWNATVARIPAKPLIRAEPKPTPGLETGNLSATIDPPVSGSGRVA